MIESIRYSIFVSQRQPRDRRKGAGMSTYISIHNTSEVHVEVNAHGIDDGGHEFVCMTIEFTDATRGHRVKVQAYADGIDNGLAVFRKLGRVLSRAVIDAELEVEDTGRKAVNA